MNSLFALSSLTEWGECSNGTVLTFSVEVDGVSRGAEAGEDICIIILKINSDSEREMTPTYSLLLRDLPFLCFFFFPPLSFFSLFSSSRSSTPSSRSYTVSYGVGRGATVLYCGLSGVSGMFGQRYSTAGQRSASGDGSRRGARGECLLERLCLCLPRCLSIPRWHRGGDIGAHASNSSSTHSYVFSGGFLFINNKRLIQCFILLMDEAGEIVFLYQHTPVIRRLSRWWDRSCLIHAFTAVKKGSSYMSKAALHSFSPFLTQYLSPASHLRVRPNFHLVGRRYLCSEQRERGLSICSQLAIGPSDEFLTW